MPRAIIGQQFGGPEAYAIAEVPSRSPGKGEVRVAIRAIGISYVDVLTAMGKYQVTPPLPFIPGSECAGEVLEVGEGVTTLAVGDAAASAASSPRKARSGRAASRKCPPACRSSRRRCSRRPT